MQLTYILTALLLSTSAAAKKDPKNAGVCTDKRTPLCCLPNMKTGKLGCSKPARDDDRDDDIWKTSQFHNTCWNRGTKPMCCQTVFNFEEKSADGELSCQPA